MKKMILALVVILGIAALHAEDSYLWWFISDSSTTAQNGWNSGWSNARIKATDGSSTQYLTLYSAGASAGDTLTGVNYGDGSTKSYYGALVTSCGSGWTYFLEVYNSDGGWNGMSKEGLGYSQASQYISLGGTSIPSAVFDFGSMPYTASPEPNSAMMLLLGISALTLRRKQKNLKSRSAI